MRGTFTPKHTHAHTHTHTLSVFVCFSPDSVCLSLLFFLNVCTSLLVSVFLGLIVFVCLSLSLSLRVRVPVGLYVHPFVSVSVVLCLPVSISVPAAVLHSHNEIVWHHTRGCTFTYAWDIHTQTHIRTHTHTHIYTHTLSISVCYSPESVCLSVSPVFS